METPHVKSLLRKFGVEPSRLRGQNFLLDEEVVLRMAAGVQPQDLVIEIGPGLGVLTEELTRKAKRVLTIELEETFAQQLPKVLQNPANLDVLHADALSSKAFHHRVAWLTEQLKRLAEGPSSPTYQTFLKSLDLSYKIIANLPYQITSKALRTFLEDAPRPKQLIVMVQKEVAERATAKPGEMSLLSLSVQAYSQAKITQLVPASAFYPAPEVDSAVLTCDLTQPNPAYASLTTEQREQFWRLARAGFASRRKQLRNNLKSTPNIDALLTEIGIAPLARAQELTIEQWCELAKRTK